MKRLAAARGASRLVIIAGGALTLGFLVWLVWRERAVFADFTWSIAWTPLALAALPLGVALVIVAFAWASVMRALGSGAAYLTHVRICIMTHLVRRLPGTVWYVAGRGYLYQQRGESVRLVSAASGLELVLMTLAGGVVSVALGSRLLRDAPLYYALSLIALTALMLVFSHPRFIRMALGWARVVDPPLLRYGQIVAWLVAYAAVWLLGGLMLYLIAYGLVQLPAAHMVYIVAAWTLTGTLSVLVFFMPTNFGFTEVALSVLLSRVMPSSLAVIVAVGSRLIIIALEVIVTSIAFGIVSLVQTTTRTPPRAGDAQYPQRGIE